MRGSAGWRRRHADPADRRRRRAAQPGPAHDRRSGRPRRRRSCASIPATGAGLPDNPLAGERRSQRPPHRRLRLAQPVPLHVAARHRRGLDRRRRLERPGRRSTASSIPVGAGRRTSAGPATRAHGRQAGYDGANLNICENLYAQAPARSRRRYFTYHHSSAGGAGRDVPHRELLGRRRVRLLPTAGPYPAEYDGALFFADYSRDCIWVMQKGANGLPAPGRSRDVRRAARPTRSTCRSARRRALLRRLRRRHDPPHPVRQRQPAAGRGRHRQSDERRGAADRELRRHRLERSRRATR